MVIALPQPDLSLALTIAPLVRDAQVGAGSLRQALQAVREAQFPAVQLDITLPGVRPRELSPRARKDLLALFTRHGVTLAGLDLFIPRKHFTDSTQVDRAVAATLAGIELAADLGRVPLALALPVAEVGADVKSALTQAADGRGVCLAIHAEDQLDALEAWLSEVDLPVLGAGLDAATCLAHQQSPDQIVHRLAKRLSAARLSDAGHDGLRCPLGAGELDVLATRIALGLPSRRRGPVILDVRGCEAPLQAALHGRKAWEAAAL